MVNVFELPAATYLLLWFLSQTVSGTLAGLTGSDVGGIAWWAAVGLAVIAAGWLGGLFCLTFPAWWALALRSAFGDLSLAGSFTLLPLGVALLLAMMRTLTDERLEPADLIGRLNVQVCRQAPGSRFITLFYAVFDTNTGELVYVNAGHTPALLLRDGGETERLHQGGVALGLFDQSGYSAGRVPMRAGDLLAIYSDGITEAENPEGRPFDERGLEAILTAERRNNIAAIGSAVSKAVEIHTADTRLADDLTLLLLRCSTAPAPAGV